MKILDINKAITKLDEDVSTLQGILDFFSLVESAMDTVVNMDGSMTGEGGEAIIRNHAELQLPTVRTFRAHISNTIEKIEKMKGYILDFEPSEDGVVTEDYWDTQMKRNLDKVEESTEQSKSNVDAITERVSHIINLGKLNVDNVLNRVDSSKKRAGEIVDELYTLDADGVDLMREVQAEGEELKATVKQAVEWTNTGGLTMSGVNIQDVRSYFSDATLHTQAPEINQSNDVMLNLEKSGDPELSRRVNVLYTLASIGVNPETVAELANELDDYYGRPVAQGIIFQATSTGIYQPRPGAEMHATFPIDYMYSSVYMTQIHYSMEQTKAIEEIAATKINTDMPPNSPAAHFARGPIQSLPPREKSWSDEDTSTAVDFTPVAGNFKSGYEAIFGVDPITGRKLGTGERLISWAGIIGGPAVKGAKAVKAADKVADVAKVGGRVEYGKHYTRVNRKKVLKPNVEYVTPAGHLYKTDAHGRIKDVEGDLAAGVEKRNKYAQSKVGREDRLPDDDGGHLIASIFKGSGDLDNLVPMNANINRGAYKKLENQWKRALDKVPPDKVQVKIKPIYKGDSQRPTSFIVTHKVGNQPWETKKLPNN